MSPPRFSSLTYAAVWHGCRSLFDLLYRTEIMGEEYLPTEGPFILASNHSSFLDPPMVGCHLPRELHYFARKTLFEGAFGRLISDLNAIPIDREGDSDLGAFRRVFSVLKEGGGLLVFPEGTRSLDGSLGEPRSGIGLIACRAGVPVVPARVFGAYAIWSRHRKGPSWRGNLCLALGAPLAPSVFDPGKQDPERYLNAARRIIGAIDDLKNPIPPHAV